jgi:hypothetical protein
MMERHVLLERVCVDADGVLLVDDVAWSIMYCPTDAENIGV